MSREGDIYGMDTISIASVLFDPQATTMLVMLTVLYSLLAYYLVYTLSVEMS